MHESVLVAPDSFKGTHSAEAVAGWIVSGLESAGRRAQALPVADGGEGTAAALLAAHGGELVAVRAPDPLGREIEASYLRLSDGVTAVVEVAAAGGLNLVAEDERDAWAASSAGTGVLIADALAAGARTVLVGAGGSASTDGGRGAIEAVREARGGIGEARLVVLCDVRTEFEAAARVFGPQKGATPSDVRRLERRLRELAARLPRDPRGVPMSGAAGGLSGGLWAAFGAVLAPGAAYVLDALGFDARMRASRAVVAGEGRIDLQSLAGKALSEVATRARQAGVPCHAVVGSRDLDEFGARVLDLQAVLVASTAEEIRAAGAELAELI